MNTSCKYCNNLVKLSTTESWSGWYTPLNLHFELCLINSLSWSIAGHRLPQYAPFRPVFYLLHPFAALCRSSLHLAVGRPKLRLLNLLRNNYYLAINKLTKTTKIKRNYKSALNIKTHNTSPKGQSEHSLLLGRASALVFSWNLTGDKWLVT